jgi:hypothetical protein
MRLQFGMKMPASVWKYRKVCIYQATLILGIFPFAMFACKNYCNETIQWAHSLKGQMRFHEVQNRQPVYLEIDWDNPTMGEGQSWYPHTKISDNRDMLKMSHYLFCVDKQYQYRASKKKLRGHSRKQGTSAQAEAAEDGLLVKQKKISWLKSKASSGKC